MDRLAQHDWPGNIRELKDVIQRAILFVDDEEISAQAFDFTTASEPVLPPMPANGSPMSMMLESEADVQPYTEVRSAFEAWYVGEVLRLTGGNQTQVAQLLGIDRNSIRRILRRGEGLHLFERVLP